MTRTAVRDVDDLYDWIADRDGEDAAARVVQIINAFAEKSARIGNPGSPCDRLSSGLRSAHHKGFNFFFLIRGDEMRMIHIVRGARDVRKLDFTGTD